MFLKSIHDIPGHTQRHNPRITLHPVFDCQAVNPYFGFHFSILGRITSITNSPVTITPAANPTKIKTAVSISTSVCLKKAPYRAIWRFVMS